jgi:hypothetical protein
VLLGLHGSEYYRTPLRVRGYAASHKVLKPSGLVGHPLGVAGVLVMLGVFPYAIRKRVPRLQKIGTPRGWLEAHICCGVLGPVLVTLHTSFKFNGVVSVAYWSMVLVVLSGFVGRYLYLRIPRTLRGTEATQRAVEERAAELKARLAESSMPVQMLLEVERFEAASLPPRGRKPTVAGLVWGELTTRVRLVRLMQRVRRSGVPTELLREISEQIAERAFLLRRIAYLSKTKALFDLWHVFHRPLVWLMFAILLVHVGVAVYFGYSLLGR